MGDRMKNFKLSSGVVAFGFALSLSTPAAAAKIEQLTESVFRVVSETRPTAVNTTVIVTSEGLAVIDATCRTEGDAKWLKGELARRYKVPVKYVILSHDHDDHICGLQVFDDTAITVSHVNAREHIVREGRNTSVPDVTFQDQMEIHLGGKRLVLYYFGPTHSDNLIQIHLPEEGVLIAADIVRKGKALALPDFRDAYINNLIDALGKLAKLDNVKMIVPGHGPIAEQQSFIYYRDYLVALKERVLKEVMAGTPIEEIEKRVTMSDFADYTGFKAWLRPNVISMWDHLYRWREPNLDRLIDYQTVFPMGYPIGPLETVTPPTQ